MSKYLKDYQIGNNRIDEVKTKRKPRKFKEEEIYNKTKKKKKWLRTS